MNPLKGPSLFVSATTLVGLDCVQLKSISTTKVMYAQFMTKISISTKNVSGLNMQNCYLYDFGEKTNLWQKMGLDKLHKGDINFTSI